MSANPLNEAQLEQLRQAQAAIPALEEQIVMAKRAGIDVTAQEVQLVDLKKQVESLLRVYGSLPPGE